MKVTHHCKDTAWPPSSALCHKKFETHCPNDVLAHCCPLLNFHVGKFGSNSVIYNTVLQHPVRRIPVPYSRGLFPTNHAMTPNHCAIPSKWGSEVRAKPPQEGGGEGGGVGAAFQKAAARAAVEACLKGKNRWLPKGTLSGPFCGWVEPLGSPGSSPCISRASPACPLFPCRSLVFSPYIVQLQPCRPGEQLFRGPLPRRSSFLGKGRGGEQLDTLSWTPNEFQAGDPRAWA